MGLDNPLHLAIIALIIVLLFGAKRLPELGRSLGSGIREFKGSLTGEDDDDKAQPTVTAAAAVPVQAPVAPPAAAPAPPAPAAPVEQPQSSVPSA
jgi:sec-independent protein translocase protein TatA